MKYKLQKEKLSSADWDTATKLRTELLRIYAQYPYTIESLLVEYISLRQGVTREVFLESFTPKEPLDLFLYAYIASLDDLEHFKMFFDASTVVLNYLEYGKQKKFLFELPHCTLVYLYEMKTWYVMGHHKIDPIHGFIRGANADILLKLAQNAGEYIDMISLMNIASLNGTSGIINKRIDKLKEKLTKIGAGDLIQKSPDSMKYMIKSNNSDSTVLS